MRTGDATPVAVACIATAGSISIEGIDEAVGDAWESHSVTLLAPDVHILQRQVGRGGQGHGVNGEGVQGSGNEVIEEGPCQGLLVDVPGAQEALGGAADAVEQQIQVGEGQIASVPSLQDIGRILEVQLAGQGVIPWAVRQTWLR